MRSLLSRVLAALRSLYTFDRPGCQVRLSLRQKLPVIALPLLALWYLVQPAPVAAAAVVCVGLLLLFSYLWARALARSLYAVRALRYAALQVGDELEEQVTLINSSILPLVWAELIDHSNLPDYPFSSVRSTGGRSKIEWRTHTVCTRRGVFTLGPWEMRSGDPFGLFLVSHTYVQKNDILVYPPLAPLPSRLLPHGQVQGEERPLHQPLRAETQDAFTARPYQPGDPLRHVHWPITARHDSPYVKVFEPEDASTLWLLADLDAAAHGERTYPPAPSLEGGGADNSSSFLSRNAGQKTAKEDSSLETMILLLASLASELLQQRVAVGLMAYSGADPAKEPQVSLPSRSPLHLWDVLRTLALLEPSPHPFKDVLEKARSLVGGRDQVLAVTPALSADWLPALHQLNRGKRSLSASVILLDPGSFVPEVEASAEGAESPTRTGSTTGAEIFAGLLARQGVHTGVVRRGELRPIRGAYGELSRWEFKTLGTGRVVVRHAPRPAAAHAPIADPGEPD